MKQRIKETLLSELEKNLNKPLMLNRLIIVITDFNVECKTRITYFREKEINKYYLTSITAKYFDGLEGLCYMDEQEFANTIIRKGVDPLRNNFVTIYDQLKSFGYEMYKRSERNKKCCKSETPKPEHSCCNNC